MTSALAAVLETIAGAVLDDRRDRDDRAATVGSITLRPHQREALRRVRESIARCGGALLADAPGLGKTFVALALAHEAPHATVVAPAALRETWRSAASLAEVATTFISMEALSRAPADAHGRVATHGGIVIVDEAHHACNPRTARYQGLARMTAYSQVLLLSATPVRNRRAELGALLALFLGPRAHLLDDAARAHCIVQRGADESLLPAIDGPHWHRVPHAARVGALIARLAPPLPAFDGREAGALLKVSLARCWASSLAALDVALRRRLQRGEALRALVAEGRVPTRDEMRAWVVGDDAVQLAFPTFASHHAPDTSRLRGVLEAHLAGVCALREDVRARVQGDTAERARLLLGLQKRHRGARIVAFTAHAATAEALYRAVARERGVALLTSRGARTAGGMRPRSDVIGALAAQAPGPDARSHDVISLVIATDLLSEGVNLQGASVIVHLDIPWTPAGLVQRVGRAARMGSSHACVHVHGFATHAGAERLLRLERRFARKGAEEAGAARVPGDAEQLRDVLREWRECTRSALAATGVAGARVRTHTPGAPSTTRVSVATARGTRRGFIAVVVERGRRIALCGMPDGKHRWRVSDRPRDLCALARCVDARRAVRPPDGTLERRARDAVGRWIVRRRALQAGGDPAPPSRERRLLLGRIDAALRGASAQSRATHAARVERVRTLVHGAVSAGAERVLGELARIGADDLATLLGACEAHLGGVPSPSGPGPDEPPEIVALLLVDARG